MSPNSQSGCARRARRCGLPAALAFALLAWCPAQARAAESPPAERSFWTEAARLTEARAGALAADASSLVARDRLNDAEVRLVGAAALRPDDPAIRIVLAEVEALRGHETAAVDKLERALVEQPAAESAISWALLGSLRSRLARYREAAVAYRAAAAGGAAPTEVYTNLGEVLMADGHLAEAEARYRDGIAVATGEVTGERRPRSQDLALAYYGLAVALDRDGQQAAARETISRALAQDPGGAVLKVAAAPNLDLFFVPDGDVYYYLGLAAEAEGRAVDAEAAFREFLARRPDSRWAPAAIAHLPAPASAPARGGPRAGGAAHPAARVVAFGTVQAAGGISAPLIDAAWRDRPALLDDCLDGVRGTGSVRLAITLEIDGRGRVTHATVEAPAPLDEAFARCAERAVTRSLVVASPARATPTRARTEIIIVFP